MKLIRRKITVHGGNEVFILTPCDISKSVTAGHNNKGFALVWGNGSGYQFLAECFSIAAGLRRNEILYLPINIRRYIIGITSKIRLLISFVRIIN